MSCMIVRAAFAFGRCTCLTASIVTSRLLPPVTVTFPLMFVRSNVPPGSRCDVFENFSVSSV